MEKQILNINTELIFEKDSTKERKKRSQNYYESENRNSKENPMRTAVIVSFVIIIIDSYF